MSVRFVLSVNLSGNYQTSYLHNITPINITPINIHTCKNHAYKNIQNYILAMAFIYPWRLYTQLYLYSGIIKIENEFHSTCDWCRDKNEPKVSNKKTIFLLFLPYGLTEKKNCTSVRTVICNKAIVLPDESGNKSYRL